jgi:hypothetical protein
MTKGAGSAMLIDVLYFSGCPHHEAELARVRESQQRKGP